MYAHPRTHRTATACGVRVRLDSLIDSEVGATTKATHLAERQLALAQRALERVLRVLQTVQIAQGLPVPKKLVSICYGIS